MTSGDTLPSQPPPPAAAASSSSPISSSPTSPPSVTITPASPTNTVTPTLGTPIAPSNSTVDPSSPSHLHDAHTTTEDIEMKEKNPTDSETALLTRGNATASTPAATTSATSADTTHKSHTPLETLTRRLSGKQAGSKAEITKGSAQGSKGEKASASISTATPAATASRSPAAPSTSKPPTNTPAHSTQRKKRKRKGLAGLFAALGCLSATEFEDEDVKKHDPSTARKDMAQKSGAGGVTKPSTVTTTGGGKADDVDTGDVVKRDATSTPIAESSSGHHGETTDTTGTTGTTLIGDQDKTGTDALSRDAVVVAPVEPVTLPEEETAGVTSSAVQPPGSGPTISTPHRQHSNRRESDTTTPVPAIIAAGTTSGDAEKTETSGGYTDISESDLRSGDDTAQSGHEEGDYTIEDEYEDEEDRLIAQGGMGIPLDENGQPAPLLPIMDKVHHGRKCLVLDLDETLLHSSFKMLPSADYIVPVEIESQTHNVYVIKRPGVDHFLTEMGKIFEIVVFTASLSKYADPVLDMLDPDGVVKHRLFRESCYNHKGNYVKDLSQLGRDMEGCIIIDNSPASYIFHPNNAVPVSTWFNDPHDTELTDLCPFLTDLATVDDIRGVLDGSI